MKSFRLLGCVWLAALAAVQQPAQSATQWKWLKADGRCCEYSDRPPPASVPEKDILQRPAAVKRAAAAPGSAASAAAASASAPPKAIDPELEARRRKEQESREAGKKAEEEKEAKARAENCERAREYQRTLDSGMKIARTNQKGEREFLDDQQRSAENERNRKLLDQNCAK